jgi:hypothetical protein
MSFYAMLFDIASFDQMAFDIMAFNITAFDKTSFDKTSFDEMPLGKMSFDVLSFRSETSFVSLQSLRLYILVQYGFFQFSFVRASGNKKIYCYRPGAVA